MRAISASLPLLRRVKEISLITVGSVPLDLPQADEERHDFDQEYPYSRWRSDATL